MTYELPFGTQFSPNQIELPHLLQLIIDNGGVHITSFGRQLYGMSDIFNRKSLNAKHIKVLDV